MEISFSSKKPLLCNSARVAYTVRLYDIKVGCWLLSIPPTIFFPDNTGVRRPWWTLAHSLVFFWALTHPSGRHFLCITEGPQNPVQLNFLKFRGPMDLLFAHPAGVPFPQITPLILFFDSTSLTTPAILLFDSPSVRLESHRELYPL